MVGSGSGRAQKKKVGTFKMANEGGLDRKCGAFTCRAAAEAAVGFGGGRGAECQIYEVPIAR